MDSAYLSRIETGKVLEPSIDVLERIAGALGVPVSAIAPPGYYRGQGDWERDIREAVIRGGGDDDRADRILAYVRPLMDERKTG